MKVKILCIFLLMLTLASCGEYNKILKSKDPKVKLTYAKKYYDLKKYNKASTLLEDIVTYYTGTSKEEEVLFLLAQSYFNDKDYTSASQYYTRYYNKFQHGEYTELAKYNSAYGLYLDSPDARLDQKSTINGIQEFQNYLELYPHGEKAADAQKYMFELQEKLAYKQYLACKLYLNLGLYMGNNYESCVVTAQEALRDYPFSKYCEGFQYLIVKAKYQLAEKSIVEKQSLRYRELQDQCYNYKNMFPKGPHIQEIEKYLERMKALLGQNNSPEDISDIEKIKEIKENNKKLSTKKDKKYKKREKRQNKKKKIITI